MEAQMVFSQLLERWPCLELAGSVSAHPMGSPLYRAPLKLPVRMALDGGLKVGDPYTASVYQTS
jgi:hypothetical protein